jgi:hypothetical protein
MSQDQRQQTVLHILQNLRDLGGLKKLLWEELNYERESQPLSMRGWPDSARKATGSFYTPRVVVDWMVDQALTGYLKDALPSGEPGSMPSEHRFRRLLSWEDAGHGFSPLETEALIDAIDHLKALDPACGSGAFPVGLLQKFVHVLKKLDPDNREWHRRQEATLETLDSSTAREEAQQAIERAFARDNDDYGRKLYLIERCLYGVDIQPIACQIAKLRFFISLIVDQTIDPKEPNYGILPLPNLETKIVAANTLLGLHRGQLLLLGAEKISRRFVTTISPPVDTRPRRPCAPATGSCVITLPPLSATAASVRPAIRTAWPGGIPTTRTRRHPFLIRDGCSV